MFGIWFSTASYENLTLGEFTEMIRADPANFFNSPEGGQCVCVCVCVCVCSVPLSWSFLIRASASFPRHHRGTDRGKTTGHLQPKTKYSSWNCAGQDCHYHRHHHISDHLNNQKKSRGKNTHLVSKLHSSLVSTGKFAKMSTSPFIFTFTF